MSSCYSTKRLIRESKIETITFNQNRINGFYATRKNDSISSGLWEILRKSYSLKTETAHPLYGYVHLTLQDKILLAKL